MVRSRLPSLPACGLRTPTPIFCGLANQLMLYAPLRQKHQHQHQSKRELVEQQASSTLVPCSRSLAVPFNSIQGIRQRVREIDSVSCPADSICKKFEKMNLPSRVLIRNCSVGDQ